MLLSAAVPLVHPQFLKRRYISQSSAFRSMSSQIWLAQISIVPPIYIVQCWFTPAMKLAHSALPWKKNITPGSKEVKTFKLAWYLSVWTSETDFDYCHVLLSFITLVCLAPEVKFTEETNIRLTWLPQWEKREAEDKWFTKSWQNLLILKCAGQKKVDFWGTDWVWWCI